MTTPLAKSVPLEKGSQEKAGKWLNIHFNIKQHRISLTFYYGFQRTFQNVLTIFHGTVWRYKNTVFEQPSKFQYGLMRRCIDFVSLFTYCYGHAHDLKPYE